MLDLSPQLSAITFIAIPVEVYAGDWRLMVPHPKKDTEGLTIYPLAKAK